MKLSEKHKVFVEPDRQVNPGKRTVVTFLLVNTYNHSFVINGCIAVIYSRKRVANSTLQYT